MLLITAIFTLLTSAAWAQEPLAKGLFCSTFSLLGSEIGVFFGLLIAFGGFLIITLKEYNSSGFIMIAAGVLISAMPGFFISGLNGVAPLLGPLTDNVKSFDVANLCAQKSVAVSFPTTSFSRSGGANNLVEGGTIDPAVEAAILQTIGDGGASFGSTLADVEATRQLLVDSGFMEDNCSANCVKSERNNNPGNVRALSNGQTYDGQIGVDQNGFAVFRTAEAGFTQAAKQLRINDQIHNQQTIAQQITRWAPSADNNPTNDYIDYVVTHVQSQGLQVTRDTRVMDSPEIARAVLDAITVFEGGNQNVFSGNSTRPGRGTIIHDQFQSVPQQNNGGLTS